MKQTAILAAVLSFTACVSNPFLYQEDFSVNFNSPSVQAGTIEVQFDKVMGIGGLRKIDVAVLYYPREDAVCLQYRLDLTTYNFFWSSKGRETFIHSLEKYKEDFSGRNLTGSGRKTKKAYGVIQGFLMWQTFAFSKRAGGRPNVELGYYFKGDAPFFTVNQGEAYYRDSAAARDSKSSSAVMLYFTVAQAEEAAALFDPRYLLGLITYDAGTSNPEFDNY